MASMIGSQRDSMGIRFLGAAKTKRSKFAQIIWGWQHEQHSASLPPMRQPGCKLAERLETCPWREQQNPNMRQSASTNQTGKPMSYAWIIDRDYAPEGSPGTNMNATGLTGPRNASPAALAALAGGFGVRFRMLDDDGGLTYAGRFTGDHESEDGFGPLDDFGTPNAGCTAIEYWLDGQWSQL